MNRKKKVSKENLIIGLSIIVVPVINLIILSLISSEIKGQILTFFMFIYNYFSVLIRYSDLILLLSLIQFIFFIVIGVVIIRDKMSSIRIASYLLLAFMLLNLAALFYYRSTNYLYYFFPVISLVYVVFSIVFLSFKNIRVFGGAFSKFRFLRPYLRHFCDINSVVTVNDKKFAAKIVDISSSGCQIYSEKFVYHHKLLTINFNIDGKPVELTGKVQRRMPAVNKYKNGAGVKFLTFKDKSKKTLLSFLKGDKNILQDQTRFRNIDIDFSIVMDEGPIKHKLLEINDKGGFVVSDINFIKDKYINTIFVIDNEEFKVVAKIECVNKNNTFLKPRGIDISFKQYSHEFQKKIVRLLNIR